MVAGLVERLGFCTWFFDLCTLFFKACARLGINENAELHEQKTKH